MTMRDGGKHAPFVAQTDDELMQAPTISRVGPLRGQVVPISDGSGGIGQAIWYLSSVSYQK